MHTFRFAPLVMIAAVIAGCGGMPAPVAPTPPAAPAVTSLVISGPDYVLTGVPTAYTATATLADGSTQTVTPSWSSNAVNVAAVDNTGRLDGRAHGQTTLTAAHDGRSASKMVQVVNNYGGSWAGRYIYKVCKDSGIFTDGVFGDDLPWCQTLGRRGAQHFAFTIIQTGRTYSEIRATFGPELDSLAGSGTVSGTVTADGRLNLEGTLRALDWFGDPWSDVRLSGWDTNLDVSGRMIGRWTQTRSIARQEGGAYEEVELIPMSRTAAATASR